MKRDLSKALENVDITFGELMEISNKITSPVFEEVNNIVSTLSDLNKLGAMSMDNLRVSLLTLSMKSYSLSEQKDRAALKQECATTLRKEAYARNFNTTDGTVAFKENSATISISEEILTELVYDNVSSMYKTKIDEIHRICDALKTIIMSKMQEAKLTNVVDM